MITKDIFKLEDYYIPTNKYYYFLDGMFKIKNESKLETLESLKVPSSTYRTNRKSSVLKNDNHVKILEYFEVSNNLQNIAVYEKTLSELFSLIYYKHAHEDITKYKNKIDSFINEENYLKPIFMLFRILINITMHKDINQILESISLDVKYVSQFPEEYYVNDFKALYNILMYFADKNTEGIKDYEMDTQYPYLSWLYHHLRGSFNYYKKNYTEAIIYYQNAISCYSKDLNVPRILECHVNIAAMYNRINAYKDAINILIPLIEYALYETNNFALKRYSLMHYFISLMMVGDYAKIINVINKLRVEDELINDVSAMVGIIASKKQKISHKSLNKMIVKRIKEDKDVKSIFERVYINKPLPKELIEDNQFYYVDLVIAKTEIC